RQKMALGTSPAVIAYGTGFLIAYHGLDGNLITTGQFSDGLVPTGPHEWFQPMVPGTSPSLVNDDNIPFMAFQLNEAGLAPVGESVTFNPTNGALNSNGAVGASSTGTSIAELRDGIYEVAFQASS